MLERFRATWQRLMGYPARLMLKLGLGPDVATWIGTLGVVVTALVCIPLGWLWQAPLIIVAFALFDMVDGQMARLSGQTSKWGAFLDSSLDRLADGALFAGVVLFFAGRGDSVWWAGMALAALVAGQLTSYVRARAESVGYQAAGGIAARADRFLILLVGMFLAGLGVPFTLQIAVVLLAVASTVTVAQRMIKVWQQAAEEVDHDEIG